MSHRNILSQVSSHYQRMEPDIEGIEVENEVAMAKAKRYAQFLHDLDLYERAKSDDGSSEGMEPLPLPALDQVGEI